MTGYYLRSLCVIFFWTVFCVSGLIEIQAKQRGEEGGAMKLDVTSEAFKEGALIPKKYTCDGPDVSPPLTWKQAPEGTVSLALICDDPDAPMGTWVHWVLYGISPEILKLPEAVPAEKEVLGGAKQGINDFRRIGYGGPLPPGGNTPLLFQALCSREGT